MGGSLRALSTKARKEILKQNARAKFPYLIEISDLENTYRYANSDDDITFDGNVYHASCFSLQPPETTNDKIGDGKLDLSIIDTQWIVRIRKAKERFSLRFIALIDYIDNSNTRVLEKVDFMDFILVAANWEDTEISWTMKFDDWMDIMMPIDKLSELICPALV